MTQGVQFRWQKDHGRTARRAVSRGRVSLAGVPRWGTALSTDGVNVLTGVVDRCPLP